MVLAFSPLHARIEGIIGRAAFIHQFDALTRLSLCYVVSPHNTLYAGIKMLTLNKYIQTRLISLKHIIRTSSYKNRRSLIGYTADQTRLNRIKPIIKRHSVLPAAHHPERKPKARSRRELRFMEMFFRNSAVLQSFNNFFRTFIFLLYFSAFSCIII